MIASQPVTAPTPITQPAPAPAAPTLPNATTRPSGLIVPGTASGTTSTTAPSGLIIVRNQLSPVTRGSQLIVVTKPLTGNDAVDAAKAAHAELGASHGAAAADVLYGPTIAAAQQIRNGELRAQAIAAILAGDLARAAELIGQQG